MAPITEAKLILGDEYLTRSASGHVHGRLFVQVGDVQFPDSLWDDFVVVVLGWWCRAWQQLLAGEEQSLDVRFMDGPYLVRLSALSAESIQLELVEDRASGFEYHASVSADVLFRSVVSAADRAVLECQARGWSSRDIDELVDALQSMRRAQVRARLRIVN